jgi:hypothetical protein
MTMMMLGVQIGDGVIIAAGFARSRRLHTRKFATEEPARCCALLLVIDGASFWAVGSGPRFAGAGTIP